jgi:hypothetical protein
LGDGRHGGRASGTDRPAHLPAHPPARRITPPLAGKHRGHREWPRGLSLCPRRFCVVIAHIAR